MPRLMNLIPCERVIVDRDGIPSLIALFQNIHVVVETGPSDQVPPTALAYREWAVFSEWKPEAEDVGTSADQLLELQFPDGSASPIKGKLRFTFTNLGLHRNHQNILGFPVGQAGTYLIRVWLEREDRAITEVSTYELVVSHKQPPGNPEGRLVPAIE